METNLKLKEFFSKLENICKIEEVEILGNSLEEYDCYLSFRFIDNHSFFNRLFLLREKEYVFQFEKIDNSILVTVSGKQELYEDILEILNCKESKFRDIDELISFMDKVETNELFVINYFNGINYFYEFSDNLYRYAFLYYDFAFDGVRYQYRVSNCEYFYEIMKKLNKNLDVYIKLMKDTDIVLEEKVTSKNTYIQELREVYHRKGNKELFIIFRDYVYYVAFKIGTNFYLYKYDSQIYIKNMIPELFQLYLEDSKGIYKEERKSCLGRSFYINIVDSEHKLFVYNIDDLELDSYLSYLNVLSKEIASKYGINLSGNKEEKVTNNKNNYGFVNVFVLSVGVLIFSILVFLITLSFLK